MKQNNKFSSLKRLLPLIFKNYKFYMIIIIATILVSAFASMAMTYFTKILIDDFIEPNIGNQNYDNWPLIKTLILFGAFYLFGVICSLVNQKLIVIVTQGTLKKIRDDLFRHMESLPVSFFDWNTHGNIMSYYTNDVEALRQMMSQSLPQLFSSMITVIGVFFIMIYNSWLLTLVVIGILILMIFIIKTIGMKSTRFFIDKQRALANTNGYIEEMIAGQKVIKVFCHEEKAIADFKEINNKLEITDRKANIYASILMPIMNNIGFATYALVALIGGILISNNINIGFIPLTSGVLISFILFTRTFINPIAQSSQQMNAIAMGLAGATRIFEVLDLKPEVDEGYVTLIHGVKEGDEYVESNAKDAIWVWRHPHEDGTVTFVPLKGDVRFYDVDFAYKPDKVVLHNVSLYAKPGQKIAFVGATGAGKTTITNLINRFYDLADGKVRYDGININKIKKADLRRSLGIVLQDTHLFTGTILENIKYGYPNATREEVINAAKLANADQFISHLPDGYDTFITNDGEGLSQGERQLLSIARAAICNPPVLILDEATSSIDTRTEKIIQDAMDNLMRGRTVFVIAHRLSTIRNSDAIMVLNQGRIIERGSHEELIKAKGEYYQLYTGAFELE